MSRKRGNWDYNYPRVIAYLRKNNIDFEEFNEGQHIKIMGATAYIELWPSRMKYHVLDSEKPLRTDYPTLGFWFDQKLLDTLLNG